MPARRAGRCRHRCEAICPGFANTGIAAATRYAGATAEQQDRLRRSAVRAYRRRNLKPETVALSVVAAVDGNVPVTLVGAEAHVARFSSRFLPGLVRRLARISPPRLRTEGRGS